MKNTLILFAITGALILIAGTIAFVSAGNSRNFSYGNMMNGNMANMMNSNGMQNHMASMSNMMNNANSMAEMNSMMEQMHNGKFNSAQMAEHMKSCPMMTGN